MAGSGPAAVLARFGKRQDDRYRARREIAKIFEPWFHCRSLSEVQAIFDAHRVCWSPYRTIREVVEKDPDCSPANPMFSRVEQPGIGTYLMPASPFDFCAVERLPAVRSPRLGEHTDEILLDVLGLSEGQIGDLHDVGVVAGI